MTIFNDPAKTSKLEKIEDRALPAAVPIVTPGVAAAVLGFAAFAVSGSLPMVGFVTLPPITYGVQQIRSWMQAKRFEREHGFITHLITTDRDMIAYLQIVGKKATAAQLRLALEEGQRLSAPAQKSANALLKPEELPHANVTAYLESTAPIDADVVDKPKALSAQDEKRKPTTVGDPAIEKVTKDVVTEFLFALRCTVLCAPPRTGKGIVAAAMMMGFKLAFPAGTLFSCTIKQYAAEDWYFQESDYHINPNPHDPIALGREVYALYNAWTESNSTTEAPSLLVLDELRDTLLYLKGVEMALIDPDHPTNEKFFDDWLRKELVSAATLNQCHKRYVLLIAPVSTASGMTFKDANSLKAYASYTIATPSELSFTDGNNGTFAAPAIAADSPLFSGWHGLAWSSKSKEWLGVPQFDADVIEYRAKSVPTLNPLPTVSQNLLVPIGAPAVSENLVEMMASVEVSDDRQPDEMQTLYEQSMVIVRELGGKPITLPKLVPNESQRRRLGGALIGMLSGNANVEYNPAQKGAVTSHQFNWICDDDDLEIA
jgi:hypothetical protein